MKRVFLFLVTNIAVLVILSIVLRLLGFESLLQNNGVDLNYDSLLVFSAVFGMGGAFISLLISKWMAKRATGAVVITEPSNDAEQWLLNKVSQHAQAAGIKMPEVAIFDSPSHLRRAPAVMPRSSPSAPGCCAACAKTRSTRFWRTRSATSPTAT